MHPSYHRVKNTMKGFSDNNVSSVNWSALSPDLNPVENIWSDMSRMIYDNGKQYSSLQKLQTAILVSWASIPDERLISYVKGMQDGMFEVIKNKDDKINK
jgi:transposase